MKLAVTCEGLSLTQPIVLLLKERLLDASFQVLTWKIHLSKDHESKESQCTILAQTAEGQNIFSRGAAIDLSSAISQAFINLRNPMALELRAHV